jgi:flagellar motor switch protein FliN/FliY
VSDTLRPIADAMFVSAAGVLGTLAGRTVQAGPSTPLATEASIRIEPEVVATITRIPAADVSFVSRYNKHDLARIVELMLGAPSDGAELDAMQLSIVAETVAQISSAMGEAIATDAKHDTVGIESVVATDSSAFPAPPFATYEAKLDLGDGFATTLTIDFDVLAQHRLVPPAPAPAKTKRGSVAAPNPAPAAAPAAAAATRRVEEGRPVSFSPMQPTPNRPAALGHANLDLVHDVPLEISAVLGQTELSLREVVSMQTGSVFELDKLSTEPIDLYVNKILIARGEVVVVDDKFAVKISELNPAVDRV